MKIPDEVRDQARDASDLLELLVRDCAKVCDEIGNDWRDIAHDHQKVAAARYLSSAILARYSLGPTK